MLFITGRLIICAIPNNKLCIILTKQNGILSECKKSISNPLYVVSSIKATTNHHNVNVCGEDERIECFLSYVR